MNGELRRAAEIVASRGNLVVLSGAGISTESGIPDFRSPGGLWARFDPEEFTYQNYVANPEHRKLVWQLGLELYPTLSAARPNAAHVAVATLEERGLVRAVITQNIDGLHQRGGSSPERVIEIHGTALEVVCLDCGERTSREQAQARVAAGETDPHCLSCSGVLKPATVSFGQPMPERETSLAFDHARACSTFLVIGSSLVVYPAASLPAEAVRAGASLVIVNREATPYDPVADVVLRGGAGEVMGALVGALP